MMVHEEASASQPHDHENPLFDFRSGFGTASAQKSCRDSLHPHVTLDPTPKRESGAIGPISGLVEAQNGGQLGT